MAQPNKRIRKFRLTTALATILSLGASASSALADFPGERWSIDFVSVEGSATGDLRRVVDRGLRAANEIYFYGDRSAHMVATVVEGDGASAGVVDLRIVDPASGDILVSKTGLPFSGGTSAVRGAALGWMETLACEDGCAVATSEAPAQAVEVAAAPPPPEPVEPVETQTPEAPEPAAQSQEQASVAPTDAEQQELSPVVVAPGLQLDEPTVQEAPAPNEPSLAAVILPDQVEQSAPVVDDPISEPDIAGTAASPVGRIAAEEATAVDGEFEEALQRGFGLTDPEPDSQAATISEPSIAMAPVPRPIVTETTPEIAAVAVEPNRSQAPVLSPTPRTSNAVSVAQADEGPAIVATATDPTAEPSSPASPRSVEPDATTPTVASAEAALQDVVPGIRLPEPRSGDVTPLAVVPSSGAAPTVANNDQQTPDKPLTLALAEPSATAPTPKPLQSSTRAGSPALDRSAAPVQRPGGVQAEPTLPSSVPTPSAQTSGQPVVVGAAPAGNVQAPTTPAEPAAVATPAAEPVAPSAEPVIPAAIQPAPAVAEEQPIQREVLPTNPARTTEPAADQETQIALAAPASDPVPVPSNEVTLVPAEDAEATPEAAVPETVSPVTAEEPETPSQPTVETRIASVDPNATGPTLANAQWVGFSPAVYTGGDPRPGAWISGPFDRKERTGWITDTATGATTRVTFIWRDAGEGGRTALMSREAAKAIGVAQGDVANVAVYLPR